MRSGVGCDGGRGEQLLIDAGLPLGAICLWSRDCPAEPLPEALTCVRTGVDVPMQRISSYR